MLTIHDFDYELPEDRIAQTPVEPRDSSRLLVLDRQSGEIRHQVFSQIVDYIQAGDLLIANDTKVIDSRLVAEGEQVRRRRECVACGERFTTFETAELVMPRLIKQDGSRQPFDEEKLRAGMQRALEKRPVSLERLEAAIGHIKHQLRATGEREVKSRVVGELVMAELQKLDEVAYIRFASVYRRFQDLNEFREEIDRLAREPAKE